MNMFKPVKATTVKEYINALPPERKETIVFLHEFIQKAAPKFKPRFAYNMLGYGNMKYRNHAGKIINWPIIALASQKQYISVYVCAVENGKYIAEANKAKLGKVSVGKSCIRFKKLEDVKLDALKDVLKRAAKSPGFGQKGMEGQA